jgi:hypothetical protein
MRKFWPILSAVLIFIVLSLEISCTPVGKTSLSPSPYQTTTAPAKTSPAAATKPGQSTTPVSSVASTASLSCFDALCDNPPPGMEALCEDYKSGILSWYYFPDCSLLPEGPCRDLCIREKAAATPALPDHLPTIQKAGKHYQPQTLDYISGAFPATQKSLAFGVGMQDLWGRSNGEDNRYYVDASMERVKEIGSELVMVTDFAVLKDDLSIVYEPMPSGAHTMGQNELKQIAERAKQNGQKVMFITNLMADQPVKDKIVNPSPEALDKLFAQWKNLIGQQAAKAEKAGVDYFIINPGDTHFNAFEPTEHLNQLYTTLVAEAAKNYHGKLAVWWDIYPQGIWFLDNSVFTFYKQLDCILVSCSVQHVFSNSDETIESIEAAWTNVLREPGFKKIADKETFLHILMPSYAGAMQKGWIEPGTSYPEGMYQRDWKIQALVYEGLFRALYKNTATNITGIISYGYWWLDTFYPESQTSQHLGHSIRGKDAEHVFYRWSKIFQ